MGTRGSFLASSQPPYPLTFLLTHKSSLVHISYKSTKNYIGKGFAKHISPSHRIIKFRGKVISKSRLQSLPFLGDSEVLEGHPEDPIANVAAESGSHIREYSL